MSPKCTHKAIAKHARIVLLDKRQLMMAAEARRIDFQMAVLSIKTIHACFTVASRTQASARFVTLDFLNPRRKSWSDYCHHRYHSH